MNFFLVVYFLLVFSNSIHNFAIIYAYKMPKTSYIRMICAYFWQHIWGSLKFDAMWCDEFSVGRASQWFFVDGLGVNPKVCPETIGLAILILRQVARPWLWQVTPRGITDRELGGYCTHDRFYMHQAPLTYMVVFRCRRTSDQGTMVSSPTLYRPGYYGSS